MGFQLIGKIIAINQIETVASKSDSTKTFQRRKVYLDCSRYDSITGEQLQENKPLLEFGGKGLEQLNELVNQGLKKGDLVSVEFAVQGTSYKDAKGNTKNYTGNRYYAIERYKPRQQNGQQSAQGQQPANHVEANATQPANHVSEAPNPFPPRGQQQGGGNDDLPF